MLDAVLRYLTAEPKVAMVHRYNVGPLKAMGDLEAWAGWSITGADRKPAKGFPDVGCVLRVDGRAMFFEVKRPSTRDALREEQKHWLANAREAGAVAVVVTSIEEAQLVVRQHHSLGKKKGDAEAPPR